MCLFVSLMQRQRSAHHTCRAMWTEFAESQRRRDLSKESHHVEVLYSSPNKYINVYFGPLIKLFCARLEKDSSKMYFRNSGVILTRVDEDGEDYLHLVGYFEIRLSIIN